MRFSSATAKMRANGASGGSRIGRGADGDDAANGDKSLEEETSTSTSTSSASAAARLAAAAPTAARRRRNASVSSSSGPKSINGKGDDHAPILAFSFLPGPLRKLFGGGGGGGGVGGGGEAAAKKKESKEEEEESDLAHYEELPDFLKDNDFVRSWYRRESTPRAAAASLWRLHNETGNIWSHALGEFFFAVIFFFLLFFSSIPSLTFSNFQNSKKKKKISKGFALFALFALLFLRTSPTTLVPPPAALHRLEARLRAAGHGGVRAHHLADYFSTFASRAGEAARHGAHEIVAVERALVAAAVRLEQNPDTCVAKFSKLLVRNEKNLPTRK